LTLRGGEPAPSAACGPCRHAETAIPGNIPLWKDPRRRLRVLTGKTELAIRPGRLPRLARAAR
jgi:hypothetical protein